MSRRRLLAPVVVAALLGPIVTNSSAVTPAGAATAAAPTAGGYHALTPVRALDTRDGAPLRQGETRDLDLTRLLDGPASAVVLNLTAVDPTADGYLTVYPADATRPATSSLNKRAGQTRSNSVTTAVATASASVAIYNQAGDTHVVVDVLGWYGSAADPTAGSEYVAEQAPHRLYDSRDDDGPLGPGDGVQLATSFPIAGRETNYQDVAAVTVNLTAVDPAGPGYLKAWNGDPDAEPFVSAVNFGAGQTVPNFAIIPVRCGVTCETVGFAVTNNVSAATDLVIDLVGVYVGAGQQAGTRFTPTAPIRVFDTRTTGIMGPDTTFSTSAPVQCQYRNNSAALNVTAIDPSSPTFLTAYPFTSPRPGISNLNPFPGEVAANAVQTAVRGDGNFTVYNSQGFVDVVVDVVGMFESEPPGVAAPSVAPSGEATAVSPRVVAQRRHFG